MTSQQRTERDATTGNEEVAVRFLSRQIMRQNSSLSQLEAVREARKLYARGIRDLFE